MKFYIMDGCSAKEYPLEEKLKELMLFTEEQQQRELLIDVLEVRCKLRGLFPEVEFV